MKSIFHSIFSGKGFDRKPMFKPTAAGLEFIKSGKLFKQKMDIPDSYQKKLEMFAYLMNTRDDVYDIFLPRYAIFAQRQNMGFWRYGFNIRVGLTSATGLGSLEQRIQVHWEKMTPDMFEPGNHCIERDWYVIKSWADKHVDTILDNWIKESAQSVVLASLPRDLSLGGPTNDENGVLIK